MTSINISENDNPIIRTSKPLNTMVGTLYFLKKFKNVCISSTTWLEWICENVKNKCIRKLIIPSDFVERIQLCEDDKSKRFIFCFLTLVNNKIGEKETSHANVIMIDLQDRSVDLFEPHGLNTKYDQDELHEQLEELFIDKLGFRVFFKATDFCPKISFQTLQQREQKMLSTDPGGFCQTWSIWWVYYRLKHADSDLTRKQLVEQAIDDTYAGMTNFIRKYAKFIANERTRLIKEINKDDPKLANKIIKAFEIREIDFQLYGKFKEQLKKEIEKITPTFQSARENIKCLEIPCPTDKMCRLSTGNCVINKTKDEDVIIENGKKYLVKKIEPTLDNFKQVYIREYIYNKCANKLTQDELYMVLFYDDNPINGADKIWKNIIEK